MIKALSALLLSCFISAGMLSSAQAQSLIEFGIRGGVNIADFAGTDYQTERRTGGLTGASADLHFPALRVGIETGLYYTQKGTQIKEPGPETGETILTFRMDYLEIPLLAKFYLAVPGVVTPYIMAGPFVGLNVNAETEISFEGFEATDDLSDFTAPAEFGLLIGAGSQFNIGIALLSLQVRYGLSFTQVFDDEFDDGEHNSVLNLTFGYHF